MARGYSLGALTRDLFKIIYPVGIILDFDRVVNPNTLFPGTTWVQVTDGLLARAATSNVAGTTVGQIGSTVGSDNVTLAVGHMPAHSHTSAAHTHTSAAHTHTWSGTTSSFDYGDKSAASAGAHTHTVSGSAASAGAHNHLAGLQVTVGSGGGKCQNFSVAESQWDKYVSTAGAHTHTVSGTAASAGTHTHVVAIGSHTHTVSGTTGSTTPGATGSTTPGATGSAGSGTAFSVANPARYVARWKRTA